MNSMTIAMHVLPLPDTRRMSKSARDTWQLTRLDLGETLPFVRQQLGTLSQLIQDTYSTFYDNSATTQSTLRHINLKAISAIWEQVSGATERTEGHIAEQQDSLLKQARLQVTQGTDAVHADVQVLEAGLRSIKALEAPDMSDAETHIKRAIKAAEHDLETANDAYRDAQQAVDDVRAGLDLFKKWELEEVFRAALPTSDEVVAVLNTVTTRTPDPELIKAAIKRIERHLDVIGKDRQFKALASSLAALTEKREVARQAVRKAELAEHSQRSLLEKVIQLQGAWGIASIWVEEIEKIVAIYRAFLLLNPDDMASGKDLFMDFDKQVKLLIDFIDQLPSE